MKQILKITAVLFLIAFTAGLFAQQWAPPKPIMTKSILKEFIDMHLEYPLQARNNKEEGKVVIGFSIDAKGLIQERHIQQSVSALVDSSALQLFDLIIWKPAEKYGKAIACVSSENTGFSLLFNSRKYNKVMKNRGYDQLTHAYFPADSSLHVYALKQLKQKPAFVSDSIFTSLNEFIYKHIVYPEEASRLNISGLVRIAFVVETSGLPSNLFVKETVGGGCTEEAVRVIQHTKWIPGRKNSLAVRTQMEIEIKFENPGQLKNKHIPNQQNSGL